MVFDVRCHLLHSPTSSWIKWTNMSTLQVVCRVCCCFEPLDPTCCCPFRFFTSLFRLSLLWRASFSFFFFQIAACPFLFLFSSVMPIVQSFHLSSVVIRKFARYYIVVNRYWVVLVTLLQFSFDVDFLYFNLVRMCFFCPNFEAYLKVLLRYASESLSDIVVGCFMLPLCDVSGLFSHYIEQSLAHFCPLQFSIRCLNGLLLES